MIPLALALIAFAGVLYLIDRANRAERETMLKALNLSIEAGKQERAELLTRIQAPEAAPFVLGKTPPKQYVTEDNDEEGWAAFREMNGG